MAYIKSKKNGFWLKCDFLGCEEQGFFFGNKDAHRRGWRVDMVKKKHYCPDCMKEIQRQKI